MERLEPRCVLSAAPTSTVDAFLQAHASYQDKPPAADALASAKANSGPYNSAKQASGPPAHIIIAGHDGYLVGQKVVLSSNPDSLSSNEYAALFNGYSGVKSANASFVPFLKLMYSNGVQTVWDVAIYSFDNTKNAGENSNSHDNSTGKSTDGGVPRNPSSIPIQPRELSQHSEALPTTARLVTTAIPAQPTVGTITSVATLYHDVVDAVHNTSFGSVDAAVKQAVETIFGNKAQVEAFFDRIAAEFSEAGKFAASHSHDAPGLLKVANGVSDWPIEKASLAALPLNIKGVQRALEKVMTDLGHLGSAFSTWFTTQHMTEVAAAVSVITVGGGTALYLRRRGGKLGQKRDEEASSSWLFARLNSAPDAT